MIKQATERLIKLAPTRSFYKPRLMFPILSTLDTYSPLVPHSQAPAMPRLMFSLFPTPAGHAHLVPRLTTMLASLRLQVPSLTYISSLCLHISPPHSTTLLSSPPLAIFALTFSPLLIPSFRWVPSPLPTPFPPSVSPHTHTVPASPRFSSPCPPNTPHPGLESPQHLASLTVSALPNAAQSGSLIGH